MQITSVVLNDIAHLMNVLNWSTCTDSFKFVLLHDGALVIAPVTDHTELYAAYRVWNLPVGEAAPRLQEIVKEAWANPAKLVIGAGKVSAEGQITDWKSTGFQVETPHNLRADIEREIARLFQDGLKIDPSLYL